MLGNHPNPRKHPIPSWDVLLGKALTEDGKPIVGAEVSVKPVEAPEAYQWRAETGPQGEFIWKSGPSHRLNYSIASYGFHRKVESWVADGKEKTVVLSKYKAGDK